MKNYNLVKSEEQLDTLLKYLRQTKIITFDLETNGLETTTCSIIGIGLCAEKNHAYYVPLANRTDLKPIVKKLKCFLSESRLVAHNGVFDCACWYHSFKQDLSPYIHADTILMKHLLDECRPFGLKDLAKKYLNADLQEQKDLENSVKANGGKWTKSNKEIYKGDQALIGHYCCMDVDYTFQLYELFEDMLEKEGMQKFFYEQETMPLYKTVTIPMKLHGLAIDIPYFTTLKLDLEKRIRTLKEDIYGCIADDIKRVQEKILDKTFKESKSSQFAKRKLKEPDKEDLQIKLGMWKEKYPDLPYVFNINSNDHLAWLLFDKMGCEIKKKTPTGKPQINVDILEEFRHIPFIPLLLRYKKEQKILNTYVEGILRQQVNGRIYPDFLQFGTTSGRYSSRNPNFQNLPRDDTRIKEGLVALQNHVLIGADYSSLEPRVFSEISGCKKLQDVFKKGEDLYSRIAIDVFGLTDVSAVPSDENYLGTIDKTYRQTMKVVALAVVYGASAGKLSTILNTTKEKAQAIIRTYLDTYPELRYYISDQEKQAVDFGMVSTKIGRIRHLSEAPKMYRENNRNDYFKLRTLLNLAKNFPIQGMAAHICNAAMISTAIEFKRNNINAHIISTVHDEIIVEATAEHADKAAKILQNCMEHNWVTDQLKVPFKAVPKIGKNMKEIK